MPIFCLYYDYIVKWCSGISGDWCASPNIQFHLLFVGGLASGIPGEVKGLYTAWEMFGIIPWKDLFEPAIILCENGVVVLPSLAGIISSHSDVILNDPHLR